MPGEWDPVSSRSRADALRLLAISRADSIENLLGLEGHLNRLKALPTDKISSLCASSGFHGWLAVAEAQFTQEHTWFSHGFTQWLGLGPQDLPAFLSEYLDLRIRCLESNGPLLAIHTRFHQGAFQQLDLVPKLVVNEWLEVPSGDPFLIANFPGMETLPRENDPAMLAPFALLLKAALELIGGWSPDALHKVRLLVREVIPCRSPGLPAFPSGSCTATPSAVFLSVTEEVDAIAEMLIHETSHIHLALMDETDPLVQGLTREEAWDKECWYSPWRDQPRSLMGVLHAIHVFSNVLDYHRHWVEANGSSAEFNASRLATLHAQLRHAMRINQFEPCLSKAGHDILQQSKDLLRKCDGLASRLSRGGAKVRFAERHRLWEPGSDSVELSVAGHFEWFEQKYQKAM